MALPDLPSLAARIDTGAAHAEISRALIVFNTTEKPLSGVAVYEANLVWPVNSLVPFVAVTNRDGNAVAVDMSDMAEGPDPQGRVDYRLLAFQLRSAVQDVPANGWGTYIAFMAGDAVPDEIVSPAPEGLDSETPGLLVLETTRHGGELPPTGTF